MSAALITEAELADELKMDDLEKVARLRRQKKWPHVKFGRFDIRYTPEQVAAIIAMQTVASKPAAVEPTLAGQTSRSRKRAS